MKNLYEDMPNGYQETIEKGMKAMEAQGFVRDDQGVFQLPVDGKLLMVILQPYYISYSGNATVSLYSFCNTLIKASRL